MMKDLQTPGIIVPEWMEFADAEKRRMRLRASRCRSCATHTFPPVDACPKCSAQDVEDARIGPDAELYTYTILTRPPGYPDIATALIGQARFAEGPIVTGWVDGDPANPPPVGTPIEVVAYDLPDSNGSGVAVTYAFRPKA
jgi:uncharacterized OB-fold protein